MIKIEKRSDLGKIENSYIRDYISDLFEHISNEYNVEDISEAGAIFFVEDENDIINYADFFLSSPITENRFEWISDIGNGYLDGCIVLDNEKAINIITKKELLQFAGGNQ